MRNHHAQCAARAGSSVGLTIAAVALAALAQTGCASWSYDQVKMGQPLREVERSFPEARSRRTTRTVCCIERDNMGRTDAVVVLLTPDQQVCGKFQAVSLRRNYGVKIATGFRLRGEVDPQLAGYAESGPVDMLRSIADDLTAGAVDSFSREAHNWVAAGIVRLIQHWPHLGDEGPAFPRLTHVLESVPAGGETSMTVDDRGVYQLSYVQGSQF